MGTWGSGNLESDYALDELSSRTHDLLTELLLRAQRKHSREYDEYDHTTLFVEFELVFALDAHGLMSTGKFPAAAAVRTLATEFLVDYDDYLEDAWPERRTKIVETFERFAALCDKHEGTAALPKPPVPPTPSATKATTAPVSKVAKPRKVTPKKPTSRSRPARSHKRR